MDIIIVILIVFFAVFGMIVLRVIINKRKRQRGTKKGEEKVQEEQEKKQQEKEQKRLDEERRRNEEEQERKRLEEEHRRKEEELCLSEESRCKEEGERKRLEEKWRLADEKKRREQEERKKPEEEQRWRKGEEKVEREAREKASKEKVEREQLEAEEKERKAEREEKAKKSEEEKKRKEDAQKEEKLKGSQELPPDKRGGRPRGSTKQDKIEQTQGTKPRTLRPEIVCWNKGWEWIVGIEVPEEFASPIVTQNDESMEPDGSDETRYPLRYLKGAVKVAWTEEEQDREIEIPIMENGRNYPIFKMRKEWRGLGRVVRRPTTGYYLAIIPYEWKRNEEISGSAPIASENVQINGYKAHFFALRQNENTPIAFINANGERIQVKSGGSRFQLIGKEISDSSEDMGPLFGEEPPRIKTFDEQGWDNVRVIVIGEEGSGRNRWRIQFSPQEGMIEQKMPDDLANRQGGWYFIRIYNNDDDLLESMDFRFSAGLKGIQIMNSECLPKPNGYENVIVQFTHQANCKVEPEDRERHHILKIRRENDLTIITVPPESYFDKTLWIIRDGDAKTKVTILVERIWWSVGKMGVVPTDWIDKSVSLSYKDFTATTEKALWVKFPRERWISRIKVGFTRTKSRPYQMKIEKNEIAIPLRDFCDGEEIENRQEEFTMKIWASPEETQTYGTIVLKIPTELSPLKAEPIPSFKIKAEVKTRLGKRKGRGFSRKEIDSAGLTMKQVKSFHISYDKRRKSAHSWNIKRLKSIAERQ